MANTTSDNLEEEAPAEATEAAEVQEEVVVVVEQPELLAGCEHSLRFPCGACHANRLIVGGV